MAGEGELLKLKSSQGKNELKALRDKRDNLLSEKAELLTDLSSLTKQTDEAYWLSEKDGAEESEHSRVEQADLTQSVRSVEDKKEGEKQTPAVTKIADEPVSNQDKKEAEEETPAVTKVADEPVSNQADYRIVVAFAPYSADEVGVFFASTNNFGAFVPTGSLNMGSKFSGVAAVGTKVVFAPYDADAVGLFDATTNRFASVATENLRLPFRDHPTIVAHYAEEVGE